MCVAGPGLRSILTLYGNLCILLMDKRRLAEAPPMQTLMWVP